MTDLPCVPLYLPGPIIFSLSLVIFSVAESRISRNVSVCVTADVLRDFFKKMLELSVVGFVALFLFLKDFIKRVLFSGSGDPMFGIWELLLILKCRRMGRLGGSFG